MLTLGREWAALVSGSLWLLTGAPTTFYSLHLRLTAKVQGPFPSSTEGRAGGEALLLQGTSGQMLSPGLTVECPGMIYPDVA